MATHLPRILVASKRQKSKHHHINRMHLVSQKIAAGYVSHIPSFSNFHDRLVHSVSNRVAFSYFTRFQTFFDNATQ